MCPSRINCSALTICYLFRLPKIGSLVKREISNECKDLAEASEGIDSSINLAFGSSLSPLAPTIEPS